MNIKMFVTAFLMANCVMVGYAEQKELIDYVDPNIGTAHCRWFFILQQRCLLAWQN